MGRYLGILSSDVYAEPLNGMRLAHFQVSAAEAIASDTDAVHAAITGSATVTVTTTTGITNPPFPRNLTITPGGTTADVKAGNITVYGTNMNNEVISEDFAFLANATDATVGVKAFKTVTSIVIPAQDGAAATFIVGFGELLGLPVMLSAKPLVFVLDDGAIMTTAPTIAFDADELEKNTIDVNGDLNGSVLDIFIAL